MKLFSSVAPLLCLALLGTGIGCADPQAAYDSYEARSKADQNQTTSSSVSSTAASTGGAGGGGCLPMPGEADGEYLTLLVANIVWPKPLLLDTHITTTAKGTGLEIALEVQAIDAHDGKTRVGPKVTLPSAVAESDGSVTFKPGSLTLVGNADPLFYGTPIVTADAELDGGSFCKPLEFVCGTLKGRTTKPTADDLGAVSNGHGSTWTMVPWDGKALPADLWTDCSKSQMATPPPDAN